MHRFLVAIIAGAIFGALGANSVVVPSTCYALDNTSHIHDFGNLVGQPFEYDDDKDPDLVVRFCKDVETRSQLGYVDYGRFDIFNQFTVSSGHANFIQEYYNGDLMKCENSYDKLGRTAQVNIICGNCPNGKCVVLDVKFSSKCYMFALGGLGCICSVAYESTCRVLIYLAIPCMKPSLRVFEGFTVGFHPRSWEVVSPEQGLDVELSGSGAKGRPPTTLSPTMILVEWRCEKSRDKPYEIEITIPVESYDPIQFTFAKMCERSQDQRDEATKGWTIFGILSCILIVALTLFCVGGFIYRTRVGSLRGLDALPGMALLSACLETASGSVQGYTRPADANDPFKTQATWEQPSISNQATQGTSERTYGSI